MVEEGAALTESHLAPFLKTCLFSSHAKVVRAVESSSYENMHEYLWHAPNSVPSFSRRCPTSFYWLQGYCGAQPNCPRVSSKGVTTTRSARFKPKCAEECTFQSRLYSIPMVNLPTCPLSCLLQYRSLPSCLGKREHSSHREHSSLVNLRCDVEYSEGMCT